MFAAADATAPSAGVSWAGLHEGAPAWLGTAREYTERFWHQQQIRDATSHPGLWTAEFVGPVLDTFQWALVPELDGDCVALRIDGVAPRVWSFERGGGDDGWRASKHARDEDPLIPDRAAVAWLTSPRDAPPPAGVPPGIAAARAIIV
jgi:hypothetical protein